MARILAWGELNIKKYLLFNRLNKNLAFYFYELVIKFYDKFSKTVEAIN
jgi:hypothetical protein